MLLARNAWLNEVAAGQARRRGGGGRCVGGGGVTVGCLNWGDASHAARVRDQCPDRRVDIIEPCKSAKHIRQKLNSHMHLF